jgi:hypothetical protein
MRLLKRGTAAWLLVLAVSTGANAALIEIRMAGADFNYTDVQNAVCDSGGGSGCNGPGDELTSLQILVDGILQLTLNSNVQNNVNLLLPAGTDPALNPTVGVSDVLFDALIGGNPGLLTEVTSGSVSFSDQGRRVSGSGLSTIIGVPSLPLGLVPVDDISWSFSGLSQGCTGEIGSRVCGYSGNATLSWEGEGPTVTVPEPSSMILLGAGVAVSALARRRRAARLRQD